jgi:mediator of RNA polymerase II transcription subunit 7
MFGQPFSSEDCIVASLESQGIRRLYSAKEVDRKRELRKLNHSALVNFLDLIDILIKTPDSAKREEKLEDLNLLFIHMHHLINEFRPHQVSIFGGCHIFPNLKLYSLSLRKDTTPLLWHF